MADDPTKNPKPAANATRSATDSLTNKGPGMPTVPDLPPSPALQWFLLGALVISGAAYVVNEWINLTTSEMQQHHTSRLERIVQNQAQYLLHTQAGDDAMAKKRYTQAVAEYRIALINKNDPEGHVLMARALMKQGNSDAAMNEFKEAVHLNPNLTNAYSGWALALDAQGRTDEASKILQDALTNFPDAGILHYNLATTLRMMQTDAEGRHREALESGKTQDADAAAAQAKSLAEQALPHFAKASRNGVSTAAFWCDYGTLLNELGKYADAEACLVRSTSTDTNLAAAHFQLARVEFHLRKYADAVAHYEKVLALTPDDPATLNELALLYATVDNSELRSPRMGAQLATRACDATTHQNARYMDTLARCYAADGDFFQAITWEDKAIHRATQLNDTDLAKELQTRYAQFVDHKTD
jgi:tetratricopeptide (TPR) repeat protein